MKWDEQVVRLDQIREIAEEFVLVRRPRVNGVDLNVFDFDFDLTWVGFFLDASERVYGRYGGRDAASAEGRLSLAGLKYAMQAALEAHRLQSKVPAPPRTEQPLRAEAYSAAKQLRPGECIHCHQIAEFRRQDRQLTGKWTREELWVYPPPENVGLNLEVDRGNRVRTVAAESSAARAGLRPGDLLVRLNGISVASFADAQYALHRAPVQGTIPLSWQRDGQTMTGQLELASGWRKTILTWRPSMRALLPTLPIYGDDLTAAEKQALGLGEKRLALRQQERVHQTVQAVGLQGGDVLIGIDGKTLDMTGDDFLDHVRRNYLVGDRITLNILRNGKRIDLDPLTLR